MRPDYYPLYEPELKGYVLDQIHIPYEGETPLEVAIGIDPSSNRTGFCMGRTDMDYPFLGMEFVRETNKGEPHFSYVTSFLDYIIYNIIAPNNIRVTHIFVEDKYEGGKKYSRETQELLSMVKTGVKSLPSRIKHECINHRLFDPPKIYLDKPPSWRKVYLGEANTNSKRVDIKKLVSLFGISKYNMHYDFVALNDLMDSIGIYSSGFQKYIQPNLKHSKIGVVDLNGIEWSHKIEVVKAITIPSKESFQEIADRNPIIKERKLETGVKWFDYVRGASLEKNIRGLTSRSNSVFMTVLETWDLESIPIYYELGQIPKFDNQKLVIIACRTNKIVE